MAPQAEVLMIAAMMVLAAREVMCFVILIATLRLVYFELFCSLAINVWRIAFRKLSSAEGRSIAGYRKLQESRVGRTSRQSSTIESHAMPQ
jgi:hypothetical protein